MIHYTAKYLFVQSLTRYHDNRALTCVTISFRYSHHPHSHKGEQLMSQGKDRARAAFIP